MRDRIIYLVLLVFLIPAVLSAGSYPEFEWAVSAGGGNGFYEVCDIACDNNGNWYVIGYFEGTAWFDDIEVSADKDYNIFIAKVDGDGNFLWVNTIAGTVGRYSRGASVAVGPSGNIFITGSFEDIAYFDDIQLDAGDHYSLFISELDQEGNFLWVQTVSTGQTFANSITVDNTGNLYITGGFRGIVSFGDDQFESSMHDHWHVTDVFVSKLDCNGSFIWTNVGTGGGWDYGNDIEIDPAGNVYIAGYSNEYIMIDFGGFEVICPSNYIVKLDADGNYIWVRSISDSWEINTSICVDDEGNVYNIGHFDKVTDFGGIQLEPYNDTKDIYICKMDTDGEFIWANQVRSRRGIYGGMCNIGVDAEGNVFITGNMTYDANFGKIQVGAENLYSPDIFIARMDAEGRFVWAKTAGGIDEDQGRAIAVSPDGNACFAGYFTSHAEFGQTEIFSVGVQDIFAAEINGDGDFIWVNNAGGTGITDDTAEGIGYDDSGYLYTCGIFSGTAYFGDIELVSMGFNDVYIAKLDTEGNYIWAIRAGGIGRDECQGIALDDNDHVFITGEFNYTGYFGDITIIPEHDRSNMFIAKLDTDGNFIWVQVEDGEGLNGSYDIAVDSSGNCYVSGYAYNSAHIGEIEAESRGNYDATVAKYDTEGNVLWMSSGVGSGSSETYGIYVDDNYVYITGSFGGEYIDFGDIRIYSFSGDCTIFIAKLDHNGEFLWAKMAGGYYGGDEGYDIAADSEGNCYVTGSFKQSALFGDFYIYRGGYSSNTFATKLDKNGEFLWVNSPQAEGSNEGYSIYTDKYGSAYIAGYFYKEAYFDDIYIESTGEYDRDIFVSKVDTEGNFLWVRNAGSTMNDFGYGIDVDEYGNSYITGIYEQTAYFDDAGTVSRGGDDIFIAKLSDPMVFADIVSFTAEGEGNTVNIEWVTEWEEEVSGFWLYRLRADKVNPYISYIPVLLNETMIPGGGTAPGGNSYSYTDHVKNGSRYFYILQIESAYGYLLSYKTLLQW